MLNLLKLDHLILFSKKKTLRKRAEALEEVFGSCPVPMGDSKGCRGGFPTRCGVVRKFLLQRVTVNNLTCLPFFFSLAMYVHKMTVLSF